MGNAIMPIAMVLVENSNGKVIVAINTPAIPVKIAERKIFETTKSELFSNPLVIIKKGINITPNPKPLPKRIELMKFM